MQQINFQGNFLKPVTIKKLDVDGNYKPIKANFIEFNNDDASALREISQDWKWSKRSIISSISDRVLDTPELMQEKMAEFLPLTKGMKEEDIPMFLSSQVIGTHVYGITSQGDNFTKIDPNKILGVVEFDVRENRNAILKLQTKPDCISTKYGNEYWQTLKRGFYKFLGIKEKTPKRPYGGVGDAIVGTLQDVFGTKRMELIPLNGAKGFYRKHGFYLDSTNMFDYVWNPKCSKKTS